MPRDLETTTRFNVDISDLKKEMQEASRQVRLANSEFKAAAAGMEDWSKSADGLTAKTKQLETVLGANETKLAALKEQYRQVAAEQGENSAAAQNLMIKINNQQATVNKTQRDLEKYRQSLIDIQTESGQTADSANDMRTATEKLQDTIKEQEDEVKRLKKAYSDASLEYGTTSDEAKDLERQIQNLSGELDDSRTALHNAAYSADDLDSALDDAAEEARDSADGFTVMKGAMADLLADGISAVIGGLKDLVTESDTAYNKFQAATGASTEEMKGFKDEMDDLYNNAYGESLEDLGDKMAYVKQMTGEVDPTKIRELTENAITLEDTFGSDFNETMRGVQNLMNHFGIDAETAFDLFAKGSQKGLDYTDELGDNIAEYGGNFQQAGYSAEEYFQLLENGSQGGAYNLDKVNDSINEIKNRIGDGTIEKNLSMFSEGTQNTFNEWKQGKKTMKNVIDSIVGDINNCESEQESLTMAATAFGTMGEDANLKVIKSLTTTGDSFKDVKGTMDEIKDVRYDDIGTQFTELGRTLKTEMLMPLAEQALPYFKELAQVAIDNIDKIIPVVATLGTAIAAAFVINKVATFMTSLKTLAVGLGIVKVATDAQTASTLALNTAWLASPVTWLAAGIAAVAAALVIYNKKQKAAIEKEYGLTEAQKKNIESSKKLNDEYAQMTEARNESISGINAEYGYLTQLKDELNNLVGANGEVKESDKDRADFIVNELATALGMEKDDILEIISANGDLGDSIDKIIEKKRAEATLNASEADYTKAIQNKNDALKKWQASVKDADDAEAKYNETKKAADAVMEEFNERLKVSPEYAMTYKRSQEDILNANNAAKATYDELKGKMEEAESTYVGYNATIANYEGLSSAILSGDSEKIAVALTDMQNNFITAETGTKTTLENQVKNLQSNYESMKQAVKDGAPDVTQESVDQMKALVDASKVELDKATPLAGESGTKAALDFSNKFGAQKVKAELEAGLVANATNNALGAPNTKATGEKKASEYTKGIESKKGEVNSAGSTVSSTLNSSLGSANTKATGGAQIVDFTNGIGAKAPLAKSTAESISKTANSGLKTADTNSSGVFFSQGFINGIGSKLSAVWDKAKELAQKAWDGLKKGQEEGSPSKLTTQSGKYFGQGFVNGINDTIELVNDTATNLAKEAVKALTSYGGTNYESAGNKAIKAYNKGINSAVSEAKQSVKDLVNQQLNTIKDSKVKKEFKALGTSTIEAYSEALSATAEKVKTKLSNTIDKLTEEAQEKYDAVLAQQKAMQSKLSEYGDLFTKNDDGSYSLSSIKDQTATLKKYTKNINSLKGKISDDLMDEITDMSVEDAVGYTNALLQMNANELKKYNAAYEAKNALAAKTAKKFYADQVKLVDTEFNSQVKKAFAAAQKDLQTSGENAIKGFISGMNSQKKDLTGAAKKAAQAVIDQMKKTLGIHSPSTVFAELGGYSAEGYGQGLVRTMKSLKRDVSSALDLQAYSGAARSLSGGNGSVNSTTVNNFYQTNNSPKALSRLDIYRQTKNQLAFAKG